MTCLELPTLRNSSWTVLSRCALARALKTLLDGLSGLVSEYPMPRGNQGETFSSRSSRDTLPSTGVTRLPRYCEPLRHPKAPGLSLAGVRLVIPDLALGPPVLRTLSLCTCCRHYPGAAAGWTSVAQPCQPSPKGSSGRPAHCPFRGLLGVHSRYGLHTRAVTNS